ncbi:hypothetical protein AB5I39_00055 [Sphingomonas sp. MMS24-J45]|uniref:hypothetical protein n=1 Tax=Sphingomonas sp. MMS24-J45 TaxID=3238806 RepID=UPI00384DD1D1
MDSQQNGVAGNPRLAFDLTIVSGERTVCLERGEDVFEIAGLPPAAVRAALDEMRGDRQLDSIALASGLSRSQLFALCNALADAGILAFESVGALEQAATGDIDPKHFVALCEAHFAVWKNRLFSGPLWTSLASGDATRPVFIGWLIESYFFIEAATARLPIAIAAARPLAVRQLFAKHFSEEYDHHHFFQTGLEAAGIDRAMLAARTPLPSTVAIRNHMRHAGRLDPLAYAACSGFLESTGEDHDRAHEFFERLTANFDRAGAPIIGPLAEHSRLDEQYQHCGMLHLVAEAIGPITRARAEAALEAARLLVETLEVWSTDIVRHYARESGLSGGVRRYRPAPYEEMADA